MAGMTANQLECTVSVVVPCFNAGRLLRDALNSIAQQNGPFSLCEILVVDDGSSDPETLLILRELRADPVIRVLENTRSKGPSGARNTGAFAAQGHWLAFLDADDLWLPDSLSARFNALELFPKARFISGDFQIWDTESGLIEDNFFRSRPDPAKFYGPAYRAGKPALLRRPFRETLATALCHTCSVILDRNLFVQANGFEESLRYKEDHHLWFRLSKLADLVVVPTSVFLYRQHANNMTKRDCAPFDYEHLMLDFVCRTEDLTDLRDDIDRRYVNGFVSNARWYRSRGQYGPAFRSSIAALRLAPFDRRCWKQLAAILIHR